LCCKDYRCLRSVCLKLSSVVDPSHCPFRLHCNSNVTLFFPISSNRGKVYFKSLLNTVLPRAHNTFYSILSVILHFLFKENLLYGHHIGLYKVTMEIEPIGRILVGHFSVSKTQKFIYLRDVTYNNDN